MSKKENTYPVIDAVRWWNLRKSFRRSIPDPVTDDYLSSVLNISKSSAQNFMGPLKRIGLLDKDGHPTNLVRDWRDDEEYPNVCQVIRSNVYPPELISAFPDPDASRISVERWFANKTGLGESQVRAMARFYALLIEADPSKQDASLNSGKITPPIRRVSPTPKPPNRGVKKMQNLENMASNGAVAVALDEPETKSSRLKSGSHGLRPSLHIDIQIHISPEASAEQIDQVFASMANHLYKGDSINE